MIKDDQRTRGRIRFTTQICFVKAKARFFPASLAEKSNLLPAGDNPCGKISSSGNGIVAEMIYPGIRFWVLL